MSVAHLLLRLGFGSGIQLEQLFGDLLLVVETARG